ncbi:hypothetical protein XELAEV_18022530mg [Xenopus laevis]|uniref:Helix-turn-helix domain-containing protein n=1 Tax=Xenopus laevis TaxID=8355 RepID=A0A974HNA1_XENLA|nr:hypothetical protein XELAEV_18022530mg [Xenopus laevis]
MQRSCARDGVSVTAKAPSSPSFMSYLRFTKIPLIHRAIVAGIGSVTSKAAEMLDKILSPLIQTTQSYVRDTSDFLLKLKTVGEVDGQVWLATLDVSSLYTSIPYIQGLHAMEILSQQGNLYSAKEISFFLEILSFILQRNYFRFLEQFYLQLRGTAMGSNMARHCLAWWLYIDDVFLLWRVPPLNEAHDDIKFTMNTSLQEISFLDRNQLLSYRSFHPAAVKKSIPTSQFTRVHRITNEPAQLEQDLDKMRGKLSDRGYPQEILDSSLTKAREDVRRTTNRNKTGDRQRLVFVGQYNHKHWHLLSNAYPTISEFEQKPMMLFKKGCIISTKVTQAEKTPSPRQYTFMGPPKMVRDRLSQHRSTVNTRNSVLPVSKHCIEKGHTAEYFKFRGSIQMGKRLCMDLHCC